LTYVVTLVTNPAISIPCGIDEHAMPFGLQVIGRFRGDRELLDAAQAMEQAFANIPGLGRPRPTLASSPGPRSTSNRLRPTRPYRRQPPNANFPWSSSSASKTWIHSLSSVCVNQRRPEASTIKLLKRFLICGVLFEFAQLQHA
jgi:hypothetical protein